MVYAVCLPARLQELHCQDSGFFALALGQQGHHNQLYAPDLMSVAGKNCGSYG